MQHGPKAVWRIPFVFVAFFPSLKQNFIAYRSSKLSLCIFEIHQLWQSGFSRVYFNCCWSCSFEPETQKICQSSHKIYGNKILNVKESTTILNACTKKSGNLLNASRIYIYIYIYICIWKYFWGSNCSLTLTSRYWTVNQMRNGMQHMIKPAIPRRMLRWIQLSAKIHGRPSSQVSHPGAQGKQANPV